MVACGPDKNDALTPAGPASVATAPPAPDNKISGDEREYSIHLTARTAKAGDVTFTITNYGTIQHEFLVVKTDIAAGEIPIGSEGRFDEEEPGIDVVDEISEFDVDTTQTLALDLQPGSYQLVCNIPNHYSKGMYFAFEVLA